MQNNKHVKPPTGAPRRYGKSIKRHRDNKDRVKTAFPQNEAATGGGSSDGSSSEEDESDSNSSAS